MKSNAHKLVFILVVLALGAWGVTKIITSRRVESERKGAEREKTVRIEQAISAMVAKHRAASDWKNGLDEAYLAGCVYSVEVERALVRSDQPVLVLGSIDDVSRKGDGYIVHMSDMFSSGPDVRFLLECDPEHVKAILDQPRESYVRFMRRFAAIAVITSIRRPIFEVSAETQGEEGGGVSLGSANTFIAVGRLLDILEIGDFQLGEQSRRGGK